MAKITRKTQKIFADSAAASQITAFGSIKANSPNPPVYSKDPDVIQSNEFMQGWTGATQDDYAPYRQDMNAIQNLVTRQLAYLFQAGIPEYDSATQYYENSFCQINGIIYRCIQDALNKNPTTEIAYWTGYDLSSYAPINSPNFTGTPTAPTPASTDNSTKIATTAFIKSLLGSYAPIDSPALTGNPTAPTQTAGNNSTRLATTAFVATAVSSANTIKPGTILPYAGSSVPAGYLQCNGAAVSRTTYSALFSAIGTTWGAGNGSTTFNLPNFNNVYLPTSYSLTVAIKGSGKTLGFTDGTSNGGLIIGKYMNGVNSAGQTVIHQLAYNTNVGTNTNLGTTGFYDGNTGNTAQNPLFNVVKTVGMTTDSTKSGLTGTTSISRMTTQKWIIKY